MATKEPLVSIVILNWNGLEDTKLCLESVKNLTYKNVEVIVVDNGSSQDQKDYLSKVKGIVYVDNPVNRGFTGGHIDGLTHAKGDLILLLNNDAVIAPDYIKNLIPIFKDPEVAAVGGKSYFWDDNNPIFSTTNQFFSYMKLDPTTGETFLQSDDNGAAQEVNAVSGAALTVRRSAVEEVGYLHDEFFAYYEETDLLARMKRSGYKVLYSPELHIWHKNGASSGAQGGSSFFFYQIFRNRYIFAKRNLEDTFFKKFKRNYFRTGIASILRIPLGGVNGRLGKSYARAIWYILHNQTKLSKQKKQLVKKHGTSTYGADILKEQLAFSMVTMDSDDYKIEDDNPLHEHVIVTKETTKNERLSKNTRYVIDRGYFQTDPLNLGCIASRMPWIVLSSNEKNDKSIVLKKIYESQNKNKSVVLLDPKMNSIAITRDYFQYIGGLPADEKLSLDEKIVEIAKLAFIDKSLLKTDTSLQISRDDTRALKQKLSYFKELSSQKRPSSFEKFLEKHYRLFQLRNFTVWLFSPRVPIRLKLGRLRNLFKFVVTLKARLIAQELRIINHERLVLHKKTSDNQMHLHSAEELENIIKETEKDFKKIPIFILGYQRVSSLTKLVKRCKDFGIEKIIFLDNNSSYQPLLDYYSKSRYQKLFLYRNAGHTAPWDLEIIRILIPNGFYIVSDPDVVPTKYCPNDTVSHLLSIHSTHKAHIKVGLGLKIDDLPDHYPLKDHVIKWESQFWKTRLDKNSFEAGVDTTFALYKPFSYNYTLNPSLRTDEPYVAHHEPWYSNPNDLSEEELYYRKHADTSITSWDTDELPERYEKEMK